MCNLTTTSYSCYCVKSANVLVPCNKQLNPQAPCSKRIIANVIESMCDVCLSKFHRGVVSGALVAAKHPVTLTK